MQLAMEFSSYKKLIQSHINSRDMHYAIESIEEVKGTKAYSARMLSVLSGMTYYDDYADILESIDTLESLKGMVDKYEVYEEGSGIEELMSAVTNCKAYISNLAARFMMHWLGDKTSQRTEACKAYIKALIKCITDIKYCFKIADWYEMSNGLKELLDFYVQLLFPLIPEVISGLGYVEEDVSIEFEESTWPLFQKIWPLVMSPYTRLEDVEKIVTWIISLKNTQYEVGSGT